MFQKREKKEVLKTVMKTHQNDTENIMKRLPLTKYDNLSKNIMILVYKI